MTGIWLLVFLLSFGVLAYHRASIKVWTLSFFLLLVLLSRLSYLSHFAIALSWLVFLGIFITLWPSPLRRKLLTVNFLKFYRKVMPTMSRTEREALAAGTVGWEGEIFCGAPAWDKLMVMPKPTLSQEELDFLQGPVNKLCSMLDDWKITTQQLDLPPEVWQYIKQQGFFGLIIPKKYGGKEFSAFAHSQILTKIYARSVTAATTVGVPNSLGPAELLLHYGTHEQQDYFLPRLAKGDEIPCFALTAPEAGSDAGAMKDSGIVCMREIDGKPVLGVLLNWNKRYITLAPVATLIGLAFKLYDPDGLIGTVKSLGITCALIPRDTPGITIGRRHLPATAYFQNGPTQGKNVFIPIDWIIGGKKMVGQGWRMLMECLAAGRAISLPASVMGGSKALVYGGGAYARIRKQFNVPIGRFEGIEEPLARIVGLTYAMEAARIFTVNMIDLGEKPAVASAIAKYHITELGRIIANDGMDIHGGKGVCIGPRNYIARGWQAVPIAITVEGANILTRNLIIFGQGAMRCHPYIFPEFEAANLSNEKESLNKFDNVLWAHAGFSISNFVRSLVLAITSGVFVIAPKGKTKRYFQYLTRFSASFALIADISLLYLGGALKRKENISARLGDILSYLYLLSSILKHYYDQGKQEEDLRVVHWLAHFFLYKIQQKFNEVLINFPNKILATFLRMMIFPLGRNFSEPSDKLSQELSQLILDPTKFRLRLSEGIYTLPEGGNVLAIIENAFHKVIQAEPIEKKVKTAFQNNLISGNTDAEKIENALEKEIITPQEFDILKQSEQARHEVIAVDDFSQDELLKTSFLNKNNLGKINQFHEKSSNPN